MKLLKIISFVFFIYFIRRMYQLYQFWKAQHDLKDALLKQKQEQESTSAHKGASPKGKVVEADFKIMD